MTTNNQSVQILNSSGLKDVYVLENNKLIPRDFIPYGSYEYSFNKEHNMIELKTTILTVLVKDVDNSGLYEQGSITGPVNQKLINFEHENKNINVEEEGGGGKAEETQSKIQKNKKVKKTKAKIQKTLRVLFIAK